MNTPMLNRLLFSLFLPATVALLPVPADCAARPRGSPNVVIILADDLGYGDLSCYGATKVRTPNADRLANEGRRFTHAYTPSSICTPTRYALMTGRYCWRTTLQREVLPYTAPLHIETTRLTLASLFKKHGYRSAAIGKWHLGYGANNPVDWNRPLKPGPLELGFDYHFGVPSNHGDMTKAFVENYDIVGREPGKLFVIGNRLTVPQGLAERRIDDRVNVTLAEKAAAFLEGGADHPFFLYFTPVAVHNPVTPNKMFRGKSEAGLYGDYILELDWAVGRILDTLDRLKVSDNTLVIFTSDNGGVVMSVTGQKSTAEFLLKLEDDSGGAVSAHYRVAHLEAEQAGHKIVGDLRGRKHSIYEGGFRVPFLARWPGKIPARTSCAEIISLADMLATLAGLLGEELPDNAGEDSYDIMAALRGDRMSNPIREAVVVHNAEGVFGIRQGDWKLIEARSTPEMRNNQWAKEGATTQLYNLREDPRETTDLSAAQPEITARLLSLLKKCRERGFSRPMAK